MTSKEKEKEGAEEEIGHVSEDEMVSTNDGDVEKRLVPYITSSGEGVGSRALVKAGEGEREEGSEENSIRKSKDRRKPRRSR